MADKDVLPQSKAATVGVLAVSRLVAAPLELPAPRQRWPMLAGAVLLLGGGVAGGYYTNRPRG